jgi:septal ring factor EnvC (AmiA/AmiB activator)
MLLCSVFVPSFAKPSQKKSAKKRSVTSTKTQKKSASNSRTQRPLTNTELRILKRDIERDRQRLKAVKQKEQQVTRKITTYQAEDKQLRGSIKQLSSSLQKTQDSLRKAAQKLASVHASSAETRLRYAATVRTVAMHGEPSPQELLAVRGAMEEELFTQAMVRTLAASTDKRLGIVDRERDSLAQAKEHFRAEYGETSALKNRKESQQDKLQSALQAKSKELDKVQADKKKLLKQIEEKNASARKLERIMSGLVGKASKNTPSGASTKNTNDDGANNQAANEARAASVRGGFRRHSLPWLTDNHTITHSFGKHTNPTTRTVTENPGIDILAPKGSPVRAVAKGVVSLVNWLPGYGSLVIIDHGNTFRTVYANLASVSIQQGSTVKAGTVLGKSGRSADGDYVHFEVWHDRHKLNPEVWLE